jgi:hypothetical protein
MNQFRRVRVSVAMLAVAGVMVWTVGDVRAQSGCKTIQAVLVEDLVTEGCNAGLTSCFIGEVHGNHGFRGTTHFKGDSGAAGPALSPGFRSYSGLFEYRTDRGTIFTRETGVVNVTTGNPESGAVTAYQKILEATGELTGVTGHFFVSGFSLNQHVETIVNGEICYP